MDNKGGDHPQSYSKENKSSKEKVKLHGLDMVSPKNLVNSLLHKLEKGSKKFHHHRHKDTQSNAHNVPEIVQAQTNDENEVDSLASAAIANAPSNPTEFVSQLTDRRIALCERSRCKSWVSMFNLEIVSECEQMTGFRLYVLEEWLLDPLLLHWTAVEYTGKEEDKILVTIVKVKPNTALPQHQLLISAFFQPTNEGVCAADTPQGTIVLKDPNYNFSAHSSVLIPDGDFDKYLPQLVYQMNLKRLNCGDFPLTLNPAVHAEMEQQFYSSHGVSSSIPVAKAVEHLIEQAQAGLRHLGFLSYVVDGIPFEGFVGYSNTLMQSVAEFQAHSNRIGEGKTLPTNGYLTPETYTNLCTQITILQQQLDILGYECKSNPIYMPTEFVQVIKSFQRARSLPMDGFMNKATRGELERIWEEKTGISSSRMSEQQLLESLSNKMKKKERVSFGADFMEVELKKRLSELSKSSFDGEHSHTDKSTKSREIFKNIEPKLQSFYERSFVSCERGRCSSWVEEMGILLVSDHEMLGGYKVSAVEDWILDTEATRQCVVQYTGNPADIIRVSVVKIKGKGSINKQQKRILKSFFLPNTSDFTTEETPHGTLLLYKDPSKPEHMSMVKKLRESARIGIDSHHHSPITCIPIHDGDFEAHIDSIKLQVTLKRLGCGDLGAPADVGSEQRIRSAMEGKFAQLYEVQASDITVATSNVTRRVQTALIYLHIMPNFATPSGVYNNQTVRFVKVFQIQNQLPQTGYLTNNTYQLLQDKIITLKQALEQAGFAVPEDPFSDHEAFSRALTSYDVLQQAETSKRGRSQSVVLQRNRNVQKLSKPNLTNKAPNGLYSNANNNANNNDNNNISNNAPALANGTSNEVVQETMESEESESIGQFPKQANGHQPQPQMTQQQLIAELIVKEKYEREVLRQLIKQLEQRIQDRDAEFNGLLENYEQLLKKYTRLKEECHEAKAKASLYQIQLQEAKKSFATLNSGYSHTNEILREQNDTLQGYTEKIKRLEEKVQVIQIQNNRNVFTSFLFVLLTWILTVVAVVVLCVTSVVDFGRRLFGSTSESSVTNSMKTVLLQQKQSITQFADDFDGIDRKPRKLRRSRTNQTDEEDDLLQSENLQ